MNVKKSAIAEMSPLEEISYCEGLIAAEKMA